MDESYKRISSLLHFALKSGNAVLGYNAVMRAKTSKLSLVLISSKVSETSKKKIEKTFPGSQIEIINDIIPGELVNKNGIMIIGIMKSEFADRIKEILFMEKQI